MASGIRTTDPKQTARRALGGIQWNTRRRARALRLGTLTWGAGSGFVMGISDISVGFYGGDMMFKHFPQRFRIFDLSLARGLDRRGEIHEAHAFSSHGCDRAAGAHSADDGVSAGRRTNRSEEWRLAHVRRRPREHALL